MAEGKKTGDVIWTDLTVPNASGVRDFYKAVVGWSHTELSMGDYADYCMNRTDGETVAGVCHTRGANAELPPVWLIYVKVADLDASMREVREHGGKIVAGPKAMGAGRYCVIQDPAGAHMALIQE
jgi:predicted enzyme related to lactoylglutathione lyase